MLAQFGRGRFSSRLRDVARAEGILLVSAEEMLEPVSGPSYRAERGSIATVEATAAKGPVNAHGEMDIAASDRDVWAVLADIAGWPRWNPAIRDAVVDGALESGAHFRFATGPGTMSCRLLEVDAPRSLAWSGRLLGLGHRQAWRIEPRPEGCHAMVDGSMSGPLARLFKGRLRRQLQRDLDAWLQLLKLEAQSRVSESREEGEGRGT